MVLNNVFFLIITVPIWGEIIERNLSNRTSGTLLLSWINFSLIIDKLQHVRICGMKLLIQSQSATAALL